MTMEKFEDSVLHRIKENFGGLFSAEKRAAAYIMGHPEEVLSLNISELAQRSGAGEATIIRMCKHLGYQGFSQMKLLMSRDAGQARPHYSKKTLDSASGLCSAMAARVAALAGPLTMDNLLKAVKMIRSSKHVYVIAAGNTTPVAMDLCFRLGRCGTACSTSLLPEYGLNYINTGSQDDLLIVISRSGASRQVLQAMNLAAKNGMHTLAITGAPHMQLAQQADCVIPVEAEKESDLDIQPDSHLLEFAINDILIYIMQRYELYEKTSSQSRKKEYIDDLELLISEYSI